jgi:superfamily I DNA and/or RNA helicase
MSESGDSEDKKGRWSDYQIIARRVRGLLKDLLSEGSKIPFKKTNTIDDCVAKRPDRITHYQVPLADWWDTVLMACLVQVKNIPGANPRKRSRPY